MWVRLKLSLRSIQDLIKESETTTSTNDMNTYSDPIDEASNNTPPPSSPPSPHHLVPTK